MRGCGSGACKSGAIRFDEVTFPYVALSKDKACQPGPYEGVELMILHEHESTRPVVVLRKCKAGHTDRWPEFCQIASKRISI